MSNQGNLNVEIALLYFSTASLDLVRIKDGCCAGSHRQRGLDCQSFHILACKHCRSTESEEDPLSLKQQHEHLPPTMSAPVRTRLGKRLPIWGIRRECCK